MKLFGIEMDMRTMQRVAKRRSGARTKLLVGKRLGVIHSTRPGIIDQLRAARSVAEVDRLLARLGAYTGASYGTRAKAARIAARRKAELEGEAWNC